MQFVHTDLHDRVRLVVLSGEITAPHLAAQAPALLALVISSDRDAVLDVDQVSHIDPDGASLLRTAAELARIKGSRLVICSSRRSREELLGAGVTADAQPRWASSLADSLAGLALP
jgi:anti-anti-sigma regulatory factor